ncbi:MAG: penicillin-binding transpeptidase domain-containing protein [Bacillota bacterium]
MPKPSPRGEGLVLVMPNTGVRAKKRILVLLAGSLTCFLGLVCRIGYIQFVRGPELAARALEARTLDVPVAAQRGMICDRNGKELAISVDAESVYVFPPQVKDRERTARELSNALGMSYDQVYERITRNTYFAWVKRHVDEQTASKVRELKLKGVNLTPEPQRVYPNGTLAAHVLGIAGIDNQGLEGVEAYYDEELRGIPGRIVVETDALGEELPDAVHLFEPPKPGKTVFLTIDMALQYIAERELDRAIAETRSQGGVVILMDPKNGEILALAIRPTFDPNNYDQFPDSNRRITAIADTYPPGSTFKPVTAAAALEEGVTDTSERFFCSGKITVPGATLNCWVPEGHGSQSFDEVIMNSCNVGFVTMGLRLGADRFYKYLESFGFFERTGIDLPGEGLGIVPARSEVKPVDIAVMSFGQTLTVTPVQLIRAIGAIANGGVMTRPHVLKEIRDENGAVVKRGTQDAKRVITAKTASELRQAMELVVEKGTGRQAFVEGYRLAGKTGTSQKVIGGVIARQKYVASFVGFAPSDDPRIVGLVVLDEPQGAYYGGQIAAPLFSRVMYDALRYLEVPPSPDVKRPGTTESDHRLIQVEVPSVLFEDVETARRKLASVGLGFRIEGSGSTVVGQLPAPGALVPPGTEVKVSLGESQTGAGTVVVPDLTGKTMREAIQLLAERNLTMQAEGSGIAVRQDPAPGQGVPPGSCVRVWFDYPR